MLYTDQMGRTIELGEPPRRIVSLVPSQSELLYDLGVTERLVGITKFCELPKGQFKSKPKVGGTKGFHFDRIDELRPDLVIGNKEENYQEGIERLAERYPVWMSDIYTLEDALRMIQGVGEITASARPAIEMADRIRAAFEGLKRPQKPIRALYFIWQKPWMVAGQSTFIDEMLYQAGFENACSAARYPELSAKDIRSLAPEAVLLSSEPFPFKLEKHAEAFQTLCPNAAVRIVDGQAFSWYGSRLLHAPAYFAQLTSDLLDCLQRDE